MSNSPVLEEIDEARKLSTERMHSKTELKVALDGKDAESGKEDAETDEEIDVTLCIFGPKSWFMRFDDCSQAYENLPAYLSSKLCDRNSRLPHIVSISIQGDRWVVIFLDGSFTTSGFPLHGKLRNALMDPEDDSEPALFLFAPGDGWLLVRQNKSVVYERLPAGLEELLKRRSKLDPSIQQVSISGFGGWFIRECEWEAIPKGLEAVLIANIRHGDANLVVSLSPSDGFSYFIQIGRIRSYSDGQAAEKGSEVDLFRATLEYALGQEGSELPAGVVWEEGGEPSKSS